MNKEKLVELAKVEFNIFHSLQKKRVTMSPKVMSCHWISFAI
jgi:hypothetical protein